MNPFGSSVMTAFSLLGPQASRGNQPCRAGARPYWISVSAHIAELAKSFNGLSERCVITTPNQLLRVATLRR